MMNLTQRARPDERFHIQLEKPLPHVWRVGVIRRTRWSQVKNPDGSTGTFISWWIWHLQWYHGTAKCDGSRTIMLNSGQLGDPASGYVMTTTPKELWTCRWRSDGPSQPIWSNMGGS